MTTPSPRQLASAPVAVVGAAAVAVLVAGAPSVLPKDPIVQSSKADVPVVKACNHDSLWDAASGLPRALAGVAGLDSVAAETLAGAYRVSVYAEQVDAVADRVTVSSDGDVAFMFFGSRRYAVIEVDAEGQMAAMLSDRRATDEDPEVWDINPGMPSSISAALVRAVAFARGGAGGSNG